MRILWSGRRGRSGNGSRRCFATWGGGVAIGLLLATTASAGISINPLAGTTDVWGLYDHIRYEAYCTTGECTDPSHDAEFTDKQGLSGGESGCSNVALVEGFKDVTGTFTSLAASCGVGHGTPTRAFNVVDIDYLSVDSVPKTNEATVYVEKAGSGDVTIAATLTPSADSGDLRSGFMQWTGGTAGANQLQRTVTKTAVGSTTVTCKAGDGGTSWSVTIVVQITKTMTVSRHPDCSVSAATVSGWLNGATALMPDNDGPGDEGTQDDVDVYVKWTWNETATTFTTCTDATYDDISGAVEAGYVLENETSGSILVVSDIADAAGYAFISGDRCLLDDGTADGEVFAHEFGHMAGLDKRDDADAIMHSTTYGNDEFNVTEAAAVRAK